MWNVNLTESKKTISFSFFQITKLTHHHLNVKNNVDILWGVKHKHLEE